MTYYQPKNPVIERVEIPSARSDELGIVSDMLPAGFVAAVRIDVEPNQVEGVYTVDQFASRFEAVFDGAGPVDSPQEG